MSSSVLKPFTGWGTTRSGYPEGKELADEYASVRRCFLNVSPRTARNYKVYLRKFMHYMHLDPDELVKLAKKDKPAAHDKLKEFWHILRKEEGLSSKTRGAAYTALRSFLVWNDFKLGKMPRMFIGKVQYEYYHVLENREISKMIDFAKTFRDQALISFLAQSGQRTGIVSAMRYRHVQDDLEAGVNPIVVNVNPELIGRQDWNVNKTGLTYRFAIGREAATFLRMSLNQRRRKGEEITSDSWLFPAFSRIDRYENNGHPICVWLKPGEPGLPITTGGIHRIIISSAKKAGIDVVKPGPRFRGARFFTHKIHPHTFRRWWKFQMRRGGVIDSALLEHMMGQHNLRLRHGGNYDEFDPDYIRREYSKAEPFLTVTADPVFFGIESRWKPGDPTPRQLLPGTSEQTKEKEGAEQGKPTGEDVNSLHRVVREKELASYFSRGWRYVATLPSGKIVIGNSFQ